MLASRRNYLDSSGKLAAVVTLTSLANDFLLWQGTELRIQSVYEAAASQAALPFAKYPDPTLRIPKARLVTAFDSALAQCISKLQLACRRHGAVGLAATQCGIDAQIIVLPQVNVFINPCILHRSDESLMLPWLESCLVLPPDVRIETLRDRTIQVHAYDATGSPFLQTLYGEDARAFQHEFDHMRGILIIDHALHLASSFFFPSMLELEAPFHEKRRLRAWERPISPFPHGRSS